MSKSAMEDGSILVPVDFSADSAKAVVHAAEQAQNEGLALIVLHVIHDPADEPGFYAGKGRKRMHRMEDVARERLEEFLDGLRREYPQLGSLQNAHGRLVAGLPIPRILEVVEQLKPRHVVMGARGHTGLSRLLVGSKTEQCLRLCPVPVTIVRFPD